MDGEKSYREHDPMTPPSPIVTQLSFRTSFSMKHAYHTPSPQTSPPNPIPFLWVLSSSPPENLLPLPIPKLSFRPPIRIATLLPSPQRYCLLPPFFLSFSIAVDLRMPLLHLHLPKHLINPLQLPLRTRPIQPLWQVSVYPTLFFPVDFGHESVWPGTWWRGGRTTSLRGAPGGCGVEIGAHGGDQSRTP